MFILALIKSRAFKGEVCFSNEKSFKLTLFSRWSRIIGQTNSRYADATIGWLHRIVTIPVPPNRPYP